MGNGHIRGVSLVNFDEGCAFPHGSKLSSSSSGLSLSLEDELREEEETEAEAERDEPLLLLEDFADELLEEADGLDSPLLERSALEDDEGVRLLDEEVKRARLLPPLLDEEDEDRVLLDDVVLREEEDVGSLELDGLDLELELLDDGEDLELEERLLDDFFSSSGGGLA